MFKDYYQILNVHMNASLDEIKEAYRTASKKWHPDRNPNKDTTVIMQDINEAYAILKDENKRKKYDAEYLLFRQQKEVCKPNSETKTTDTEWTYDYDIKDEELKNDIYSARKYAKDLVDEFIANLKQTSKVAAKGAWDGMKGYLLGIIIVSIIGLIIAAIISTSNYSITETPDYDAIFGNDKQYIEELLSFQTPDDWKRYRIKDRFQIAVPSTVELRTEKDTYSKQIKSLNYWIDEDVVVFQQKDLSKGGNNEHYCRIMLQYSAGEQGDFLKSDETPYFDNDAKTFFRELVDEQVATYTLLTEPSYWWIDINGTKAVKITYRRTASENYTTHCTMYLLFNYSEAAKIIVSYREQEKELWLPDFDNVIRTFKWEEPQTSQSE